MQNFFTNSKSPSPPAADSRVAIFLATYNGEKYLRAQIASLINQTHTDWIIYASDDGSEDATLEILYELQSKTGDDKLVILQGPGQGYVRNFMSLVKKHEIKAPYFAYCDQDDIWHPDRLAKGLQWQRAQRSSVPTLYCSRTDLISSSGEIIGRSSKLTTPPSFQNALVQNIAGGNTMLFNEKARQLLSLTNQRHGLAAHDWWTYLLISGSGGVIHFDLEPTINYRQHDKNLIGASGSVSDIIGRFKNMLDGGFSKWNSANISALHEMSSYLSPEHKEVLNRFEKARHASLVMRVYWVIRSGVHRQTLLGNIGMAITVLLNKL